MIRFLGPLRPAGYTGKDQQALHRFPKSQVPAHPSEIKPGGTRDVGGLPF